MPAPPLAPRQHTQLIVEERNERIERVTVSGANLSKQPVDRLLACSVLTRGSGARLDRSLREGCQTINGVNAQSKDGRRARSSKRKMAAVSQFAPCLS
jgi:hypothetical protein